MDSNNVDAIVTVGDNDPLIRSSMLEAIVSDNTASGCGQPNAYLTGRGQWGGVTEHAGALLYTDMTPAQASAIRVNAQYTGWLYQQEAVGVAVIPAGSALVYCIEDK